MEGCPLLRLEKHNFRAVSTCFLICFLATFAEPKAQAVEDLKSFQVAPESPTGGWYHQLLVGRAPSRITALLTLDSVALKAAVPKSVSGYGGSLQSLYESNVAGTVASICTTCHRNGGIASFAQPPAQLLFTGDTEVDRQRLTFFVAQNGSERVLSKVQGINHGGGIVLAPDTAEFTLLAQFLELLGPVTPQQTFQRLLEAVQSVRGRR